MPGPPVGTAIDEGVVANEHLERHFDRGEIRFQITIPLVQASTNQTSDQRGTRQTLSTSNLVERTCLLLIEVDICPVHTPDYTPGASAQEEVSNIDPNRALLGAVLTTSGSASKGMAG